MKPISHLAVHLFKSLVCGLTLGWVLAPAAALRAAESLGSSFSSGGGRSAGGKYAQLSSLGQMGGGLSRGGAYAQASGLLVRPVKPAANLPADPNAPVFSPIADQMISEDSRTDILSFTITDADTSLSRLSLTRESSNPTLVPVSQILLGGSLGNRTVRVTPAANQFGSAIISVVVSDGVHTVTMSFVVVVKAVNDLPTLQSIVNAVVNEDAASGELSFLVGDLETPAGDLIVSASAADPELVPSGNITFGGSGANRWLRILPAPNLFGGTTITYRVSDGEATTERTFPFTVISNNDAPSVSPIGDVSLLADEARTVEFTIADVDHSLAELTLNLQSDNSALINSTGLKRTHLGGGQHSLLLTPITGRTGVAVITVTAVDPRGATGKSQFRLKVTAAIPKLDFGDAPPVYPVLLAAKGAWHTIKPGFALGAGVDAESEGQPNATATGDDATAPDDEDGVQFLLNEAGQPLLYNGPAGLGAKFSSNHIVVTASAAGKLDAWLDLNRDGDWNDAGERIFTARTLVPGANRLSVVVSNTAAVGATFARFRFSSSGNLSPGGGAEDGEVEDYGVIIAPAQSESPNLFGGLKYSPVGNVKVELLPEVMVISNLTAQAHSGVRLELGQAMGLEGEIFKPRGASSNNRLSLQFRGSQGGQSRDVAQVKWDGPEFDASKSEVSIETLEVTPAGLTYQQATVRLFNGRGEPVFVGKHGASGFKGAFTITGPPVLQIGDTATHEVGHWLGVAAPTARFADSPTGGGLHLMWAWAALGITSPRDSASGLPKVKRVAMPDGKSVEAVAFAIFSFEGLSQPVDFLERAEFLGSGVGNSFGLARVGLLSDGFRVKGVGNTRLSGHPDVAINGVREPFYWLPEVGDEVVVSFAEAHLAAGILMERRCCAPGLVELPPNVVTTPGSSFRMSATQSPAVRGVPFHPPAVGRERSFVTSVEWPEVNAGARPAADSLNTFHLKLSYSGPNLAHARFGVTAFGAGNQVEAFTLEGQGSDVNVEEVELMVSGFGKPVSLQPGFLNRGESTPRHRVIFDRPMAVVVVGGEGGGGKVYEAQELWLLLHGGMVTQTDDWDFDMEYRCAHLDVSWGGTGVPIKVGQQIDWGDAPFGTTAAQKSAASHKYLSDLRLGKLIDFESDGHTSPDATGDDAYGSDDEDGVTFASVLVPGADWVVNIVVAGAPNAGAFIDAFVDWDTNQVFSSVLGEKVLDRRLVHNGGNLFNIRVPTTAKLARTFARFRLSTAGGLDSGGRAEDGEVEDYAVRVAASALPAQLSGLIPVPRGAAKTKLMAEEGIEISEFGGNSEAGLSLIAPSNVVSRSAGRILLPLNPPLPLFSWAPTTQPFADGLVLEAHYTEKNGQRRTPSLRFQSDCTRNPCDVVRVGIGGCDGHAGATIRVFAFTAGRYAGDLVIPCGELGTFKGSAKITQLGWATFPASALVFFDQNALFTSADGRSLSGKLFRFSGLFFDEYETGGNTVFDRVDVYGPVLGAKGTAGFESLKVINPQLPAVRTLTLLPNGSVAVQFPAEETVFYHLEELSFKSAANYWSEIGFHYLGGPGAGAAGTVVAPAGETPPSYRFFRLRAE